MLCQEKNMFNALHLQCLDALGEPMIPWTTEQIEALSFSVLIHLNARFLPPTVGRQAFHGIDRPQAKAEVVQGSRS